GRFVRLHARDQPAPHALLDAAAAARDAFRLVLRRAHPPPIRGDPGALLRDLGAGPGEPGRRAAGARVHARGARARRVRGPEPRVPREERAPDPDLGLLPALPRLLLGAGGPARPLPRRPRGPGGPHYAGTVRGLYGLTREPQLAAGGARLGGGLVPARRGRVP